MMPRLSFAIALVAFAHYIIWLQMTQEPETCRHILGITEITSCLLTCALFGSALTAIQALFHGAHFATSFGAGISSWKLHAV